MSATRQTSAPLSLRAERNRLRFDQAARRVDLVIATMRSRPVVRTRRFAASPAPRLRPPRG
jgi:hypothetical protein